MASHGPYDSAYMPEVNVPGGGPGTSAEMSEYLRRAAMASLDRDFFMVEGSGALDLPEMLAPAW